MNRCKWTSLTAAAFMAAMLAACDKTGPSLIKDEEINAELATSEGDAMALAVLTLIGNESAASLGDGAPPGEANLTGDGDLQFSRARVCYDASFAVVAGCSPIASVRTIVTNVTLDASRSGDSDDGLKSWSGGLHHTAHDSLTRVFVAADETQRIHNGVATANDSTTLTAPEKSFFFAVAASDSVKAVTFSLPRPSNPWPVSGAIVRNANVHVIVTKDGETESRNITRRIEVTFPADAQGNVQLKINSTTCNLNLVTHRVTACVTP
jgi:hypothetical protein